MNTPDSFPAHLAALEERDRQLLFDLIEEIELTRTFGELTGGEMNSDSEFTEHWWKPAPVVERFVNLVNKLGLMISFDWPRWQEGQKILEDESADYSSLDSVTLCKLLTMMIRADRFQDGFLITCFEKGRAKKILQSLYENLEGD